MNKVNCQNLRSLAKVVKNPNYLFTYVVMQRIVDFSKFSIRQVSRWAGLSGPDIIVLAFTPSA